ncbi:hypothetical protein [Neptuniibacter sp. QD37_11]|uniref:hypothetical protein n=1 Tax=Neptuniibacter sp. QD37_11 TaxID=3398209 RepID=UPI0039F50E22
MPESWIDQVIDAAKASNQKRVTLCKNPPRCPECDTPQVQLVEWINPVEWKCRHCKHKWSSPEEL